MTHEIVLTRGLVTLVDDQDIELLTRYTWHAHPGGKTFYARHRTAADAGGTRFSLFVHRLVLALPPWEPGGLEVDHIDRNGLNNTRANLRVVTHQENALNRTREYGYDVTRTCPSGHEREAGRPCLTCGAEKSARYRARRRVAVLA